MQEEEKPQKCWRKNFNFARFESFPAPLAGSASTDINNNKKSKRVNDGEKLFTRNIYEKCRASV